MISFIKRLGEKIKALTWHDKSDLHAKRFWMLFLVVLAVIAFIRPAERTITHHYSRAAYAWFNEEPLYSGSGNGFLYFPQSIFLYTPFLWQPFPENFEDFGEKPFKETLQTHFKLRSAEAFYRIISVGFFAFGIWSLCGALTKPGEDSPFFAVSLMAFPASIAAASNGQFNVLLAATILLSSAAIIRNRWWWATLWLVLGLAAKPHGIIPFLLFGVLMPQLWWRLPVGLVFFSLFGFAHWNQAYVIEQWKGAIHQIQTATRPDVEAYDDIAAMFRKFGIDLSDNVWFVIRAAFSLVTLWMAWIYRKHFNIRLAIVLIGAAATAYMMIFNPRTETNSFLILSPFIGSLAALMFRDGRESALSWILVFICIGLGSDNYLYDLTRIWWKPFISCIFFGLLLYWAIKKKSSSDFTISQRTAG